MKKLPTILRRLLPMLIGGGLGAAYYHFFGCSGSCAITSNPWLTIIYGALIGYLLFGGGCGCCGKDKDECNI